MKPLLVSLRLVSLLLVSLLLVSPLLEPLLELLLLVLAELVELFTVAEPLEPVVLSDDCAALDSACASPRWTAMPPTTRVDTVSRLADHSLARCRGRGMGLMDVSFGGVPPPSGAALCPCCARPARAA